MIIANGYHIINNKEWVCPMIYADIDITKLNHFASVLSSDCKVPVEPFKFTNDNDGFCKLRAVFKGTTKTASSLVMSQQPIMTTTLSNFLLTGNLR